MTSFLFKGLSAIILCINQTNPIVGRLICAFAIQKDFGIVLQKTVDPSQILIYTKYLSEFNGANEGEVIFLPRCKKSYNKSNYNSSRCIVSFENVKKKSHKFKHSVFFYYETLATTERTPTSTPIAAAPTIEPAATTPTLVPFSGS